MKWIITIALISSLMLVFIRNKKKNAPKEFLKIISIKEVTYKLIDSDGNLKLGDPGYKTGFNEDHHSFYDINENIIEKRTLEHDGSFIYYKKLEYDNSGRISKINYYDEKKLYATDLYDYSKDGITIITMIDESTDKRKEVNILIHDEKGNLIERKWIIDKKLIEKYQYFYDISGNKIEEYFHRYVKNTSYNHIKYSYKEDVLVVKRNFDRDNKMYSETTYSYDKFKNVKEEVSKTQNYAPSKLKFDYKYDTNNNWTRKNCYRNGEAEYAVLRKIQYQ